MNRPILIIGHPRCGSGYMAKLCESYGLDVGHEKGTCVDGISNWAFAVEHDPAVSDVPRWGRGAPGRESFREFDYVIHHVRNPVDALPSICHNEICFVTGETSEQWSYRSSFLFRYAYIFQVLGKCIDLKRPLLDVAIQSLLYWNEVVALNNPHLTVRVEDCEKEIGRFLGDVQLVDTVPKKPFSNKRYNTTQRNRITLTGEAYSRVRMPLLRQLDSFCQIHGYRSLFKQIQSL
jgi:hypothetical protein